MLAGLRPFCRRQSRSTAFLSLPRQRAGNSLFFRTANLSEALAPEAMLTSRNSRPNSCTLRPSSYTAGSSQCSLLLSRILAGSRRLGSKSAAACMAWPWSLTMNTSGSTSRRSPPPGRTSTVKKLERRYPQECCTACASWYSAMVRTCSSVKCSLSLGEATTIPTFSRPSASTISSTFLLRFAGSLSSKLVREPSCSGSQSASTTALMPLLQKGSSAQQPQRKATRTSAICLSCAQQSIKPRSCLLFTNCTQSTCRYSCRLRVTLSGTQRLQSPRGQGSWRSQRGSRASRGFLGGRQLGHSLPFGCWHKDRLLSRYSSKATWAVLAEAACRQLRHLALGPWLHCPCDWAESPPMQFRHLPPQPCRHPFFTAGGGGIEISLQGDFGVLAGVQSRGLLGDLTVPLIADFVFLGDCGDEMED